ncbi:MAG TPA: ABC transporter permease subunit [Rhizobiaceae bacterium]|nr:ABC transporter permease subunit [Rhizobiaceae bacterium]
MLRHMLRRSLFAIPTLFGVITLSFLLMRIAPGGPFTSERPLLPTVQAAIEAKYGLNDPIYIQLINYWAGLIQGDLGPSLVKRGWTASSLIEAGLPVSLELGMWAILVSLIVGIPAGAYSALHPGSLVDRSLMSVSVVGIAVPNFVLAPVLVYIFSITFSLLPVGGWGGGSYANKILPVASLSLPLAGYLARLLRSSMIEVLAADFIRTAIAKGVSIHRILFVHALKPSLIPVASFMGPAMAGVLTGSVVIERVFAIPGIGTTFIDGAVNRDYFVVLGALVVYATLLIVLNLVVDLAYAVLDPRVQMD